MLAKSILNSIEVLISKALIDSNVSHNESVLINNALKEYENMKENKFFPVFGLNMEIYLVNRHIQSDYRKIRTRKSSAFGHFSRSVKQFIEGFSLFIKYCYRIV